MPWSHANENSIEISDISEGSCAKNEKNNLQIWKLQIVKAGTSIRSTAIAGIRNEIINMIVDVRQ